MESNKHEASIKAINEEQQSLSRWRKRHGGGGEFLKSSNGSTKQWRCDTNQTPVKEEDNASRKEE